MQKAETVMKFYLANLVIMKLYSLFLLLPEMVERHQQKRETGEEKISIIGFALSANTEDPGGARSEGQLWPPRETDGGHAHTTARYRAASVRMEFSAEPSAPGTVPGTPKHSYSIFVE